LRFWSIFNYNIVWEVKVRINETGTPVTRNREQEINEVFTLKNFKRKRSLDLEVDGNTGFTVTWYRRRRLIVIRMSSLLKIPQGQLAGFYYLSDVIS
jgi:hypothetical protein